MYVCNGACEIRESARSFGLLLEYFIGDRLEYYKGEGGLTLLFSILYNPTYDGEASKNECTYAWAGLRNTIRNSNFASTKLEDRAGGTDLSLLSDSRYSLSR